MTVSLTSTTFDQTIDSGIVLVDFWAAWCRPCRAFTPVFTAVSEQNPDLVFATVDTEEQDDLAARLSITSIPTLMIFRDGILVFAQPGALRRKALERLVVQVRELDMDDVRRMIDQKVDR